MIKIGGISLDTSKKICVTNVFEDVICDPCDPCHAICFFLFTVTSIHSIHKITKMRNLQTLNKMESDAEDSSLRGSKDRKIEMISRKVSRRRKGIQKKKLSDTQFDGNVTTVAKELVSSENRAS